MLNLRSLGQVVGVDQGITSLLEGGEQVKCLVKFVTHTCRRPLL